MMERTLMALMTATAFAMGRCSEARADPATFSSSGELSRVFYMEQDQGSNGQEAHPHEGRVRSYSHSIRRQTQ